MAFQKSQYDVVLINPPARVVREHYDEPDYPAIGIAYIGNYLETHGGIAPAIIDGKLGRLTVAETVSRAAMLRPKVVGLTSMTHMIAVTAQIAEELKCALPDVTVVLGGFHGSFLPERTLQEFPVFDYIVVGEGEMAFTELVGKLLSDGEVGDIPGLCYRRNGQAITNGRGAIPETLDELGEPGWHLFDPEAIEEHCVTLPIMSQRGCPFSCNFCSRPYGQMVRQRSPARVVDEIEASFKRHAVKKYAFYDETFTVVKDHVRGICRHLAERGLSSDIEWESMVHANTVNKALIQTMKNAGCTYLGFGVESGHEDIIKAMKKGVTKERILKAAKIFKEVGVRFGAYFILGHPNESHRSLVDTIRFAVRLNADITAFGIMVPYPGTEVWELAQRGEGGYQKLSLDWEDYNKQVSSAVELRRISRRKLKIFQLAAYLSVYLFHMRFRAMGRAIVANPDRLKYILASIVRSNSRLTKEQPSL